MYFQKVIPMQTNFKKKNLFCLHLEPVTKKSRIRIRMRTVGQRYGLADPDPYQNVTDPRHWYTHNTVSLRKTKFIYL
jgi:hypothetical protein